MDKQVLLHRQAKGQMFLQKIFPIAIYSLGITSAGFIVSVISFYIHAHSVLGYWPSYDHPDPGKLPFYSTYYVAVNITASIWLYSFLIWLVIVVPTGIIFPEKRVLKKILISGIGHAIGMAIFWSEIMEWIMD